MQRVLVGDKVFDPVVGHGSVIGLHEIANRVHVIVAWSTSNFCSDGFGDEATVVAEVFSQRWVWKDHLQRWEIRRMPRINELIHDSKKSRTGRIYETPHHDIARVKVMWFEKKDEFAAIIKMEVNSQQAKISMKRVLNHLLTDVAVASMEYDDTMEIWVIK